MKKRVVTRDIVGWVFECHENYFCPDVRWDVAWLDKSDYVSFEGVGILERTKKDLVNALCCACGKEGKDMCKPRKVKLTVKFTLEPVD